jgi:DNA invertase Pin-like site-specific DNA recombinase
MARIGYARVSTEDQHPEIQVNRLEKEGRCEKVFTDHGVSGKFASRPEFGRCLEFLREGDVLVVTKLDRAGRSVLHLCQLVADLRERGVDFAALDQAIDTTSSAGKLQFHVLAAVAEFERDLISARTKDGLAAAREKGHVGGRPAKLDEDQARWARRLYEEASADGTRKHKVSDIARKLNVGRSTVYRYLQQEA